MLKVSWPFAETKTIWFVRFTMEQSRAGAFLWSVSEVWNRLEKGWFEFIMKVLSSYGFLLWDQGLLSLIPHLVKWWINGQEHLATDGLDELNGLHTCLISSNFINTRTLSQNLWKWYYLCLFQLWNKYCWYLFHQSKWPSSRFQVRQSKN